MMMFFARFPLAWIFLTVLVLAIAGAVIATLAAGNLIAIGAVLVIAFIKARFVILDFMELRHGQRVMAASLMLWCALLLAVAMARPVIISTFA